MAWFGLAPFDFSWWPWRHQVEAVSTLLDFCEGILSVTDNNACFNVFFEDSLKKRLHKQPSRWWFETPGCSIWRHCNVLYSSALSHRYRDNRNSTYTSLSLEQCYDCLNASEAALEWGLLSQFPPFHYIPNFSASPKYMLVIEYHAHIWQMSPQLRCVDTCQIWMWYKESNRYFGMIENVAYGEINEMEL